MKMCCYFINLKLLILKILLAGLTGLAAASRYDYGYHPSAEEFDNLLSETRRTWTHSFLKAERDRLFQKPTAERRYDSVENRQKVETGYFVPKFQYENNEAKKSNQQDLASSQNINSFIDFNNFSDELPKPFSTTDMKIHQTFVRQPAAQASSTIKTVMAAKPDASALPEVKVKPLAKPDILNTNKYSLNNLYTNNSQANFPIYFTNPATGIVYAITQVGKSTESATKTNNGSIPIFISKEQYEKDILQLEREYKQNCKNLQTTRITTPRPKIIRLQNISPPDTTTTLDPLKKPPPVVVKAELIVKDKKTSTTTRPVRKKKTKTPKKRKIKKQNLPGHKSTTTTTLLDNQSEGPIIVIGSRTKPKNIYENNEKLSTQLEKPNFDVFSSAAAPQTEAPLIDSHRVNKRSLGKQNSSEAESLGKKYFKNEFFPKKYLKTAAKRGSTFKRSANFLEKSPKLDSKYNTSKDIFDSFARYSLKPVLYQNPIVSKEINETVKEIFKKAQNILTKLNFKKMFPNSQKFNLQDVASKKKSDLKHESRSFKNKENNRIRTRKQITYEHLTSKNSQPNHSYFVNPIHHIRRRSADKHNSTTIIAKPSKIENIISSSNQTEQINNGKLINPRLEQQNKTQSNTKYSANSTEVAKSHNHQRNSISRDNKKRTLKHLKKRKRLSKVKLLNKKQRRKLNKNNSTNSGKMNRTQKKKNLGKKSQRQQDADYFYFFNVGDDYDDDDDDDDEEEDEDDDGDDNEVEDEDHEQEVVEYDDEGYKDPNDVLAYDYEPYQTHTVEAGLSAEDLSERVTTESTSSPEIESQNYDLRVKVTNLKKPDADYNSNANNVIKTQSTQVKKRIRRRPTQTKIKKEAEEADDDEDDNSISSNMGEFFRMMFYPVQVVMSNVMESFSGKYDDEKDDDANFNPYTKYTSYHNMLKQHSVDEKDDDYDSNESHDSYLSSWFGSWFPFNRRNKKISSTTVAPIKLKPTKSSSWLPSWMTFGSNDRISTETSTNEDYDEYDKWFAGWFGETKPRARKKTTTTTSTTTQIPHVPILTIVDPMKNPQNWIGILAHHIINQTSTSTSNPLKDIWNTVTSTTTENPEIPRKISYDKYQIWRLKPQDDSQVKALEEYKKSEDGIKLQWLKGPSLRGLTDVLVPPKMLVDFQASLTFELVDHEVLIFDVGKAIAYEKSKEDYFFTTTQRPKKHSSQNPKPLQGMTWHKYYEYDDIVKYLETMRMRFPHLVELIHIGRSYEGRPLIVMKIESKEAAAINMAHYPAHQGNKLRHKKRIGLANAVFIEAGTHGMEWIGPATATWIINDLLRIMKKNVTDEQSFIRNTTWYIMPVLNPDGYVYSHEFDRFWKKSRSRHVSRPSGILNSAMTWLQKKRAREKICFGVDLDRNWHYQWGKRGSSKSACNEFYAGPTPFSEPETKALSDFLMDYRTQIKLFISMQSYGQIISYPYKANTTYDSERLDDLLDVAMVGTDGLRKKGSKSRYKIDSSNDLVENRSGCSDAFAAYEVGIPFSYTIQLADNGVHGYLLPSASIQSTAKDSFEIITGMLDYI